MYLKLKQLALCKQRKKLQVNQLLRKFIQSAENSRTLKRKSKKCNNVDDFLELEKTELRNDLLKSQLVSKVQLSLDRANDLNIVKF
jgi:hypothetical protein